MGYERGADEYVDIASEIIEGVRQMGRRAARSGGADAKVLRALARAGGGATPSELAAELGCSRPRVTRALNELEGQGCVRRAPDPTDRRSVIVSLTEAGARRAAATDDVNDLAQTLSRLGRRDALELRRIIGRVQQVSASPEGAPAGP